MSSEPSYLSALKSLARERTDLADILVHVDYLPRAEDRAAAILVCTRLEDGLQDLIMSKMVSLTNSEIAEIFGGDRLLGSFNAKTQVSYALGLIGPKTRRDLNTIRHIRNTFAHSRKAISFERPEIATACDHLTLLDRYRGLSHFRGIEQPIDSARRRYIATVSLYLSAMFQAERGMPELGAGVPDIPLD